MTDKDAAQLARYIRNLNDDVASAHAVSRRSSAPTVRLWGGLAMLACVLLLLVLFIR